MILQLRTRKSFILVVFVLIAISSTANAVELMKWERMPLTVPLYVGQERIIFIDSNVRVGIPSSLNNKLRVQSSGGTVYLLAMEPIAPTRLQLQDAELGTFILMDITATNVTDNSSPLEPIQIIEGDHTPVRYGREEKKTQSDVKVTIPSNDTPVPVILTRYAAQNLYAPLRTVEPINGITRVNVNKSLDLQTLLPLLPINAKAMAAWRLNDYFVTAVLLINTSRQIITLDPRQLQGNFVAATFQHPNLGPAQDSTDTTVVYLITRQYGLSQALLPTISPINPQPNLIGSNQ